MLTLSPMIQTFVHALPPVFLQQAAQQAAAALEAAQAKAAAGKAAAEAEAARQEAARQEAAAAEKARKAAMGPYKRERHAGVVALGVAGGGHKRGYQACQQRCVVDSWFYIFFCRFSPCSARVTGSSAIAGSVLMLIVVLLPIVVLDQHRHLRCAKPRKECPARQMGSTSNERVGGDVAGGDSSP